MLAAAATAGRTGGAGRTGPPGALSAAGKPANAAITASHRAMPANRGLRHLTPLRSHDLDFLL